MSAGAHPTDDVTQLLEDWQQGDEQALSQLMELIYGELRRLAAAFLRRERSDHTLKTTDLVHEAYLRLVDQNRAHWHNRAHFLAIAAQMMRRILVNHAQAKLSAKRGQGARPLELDEALTLAADRAPELVALDEALTSLSTLDPEQASIVEMRFFGGLGREEIAEVLDLSVPTVARRWRMARAWLYRHLSEGDASVA